VRCRRERAGSEEEPVTAATVRRVPLVAAAPPGQLPALAVAGQGDGVRDEAAGRGRVGVVRSWPLLLLALPAAVATWSGWVGIGRMTGFGLVRPLPGTWDSLQVNTAVTLPVGVEAYAAFALRAWLSASPALSARTRRFARWSAIGSLGLGMAGQVAYHLLAQAHAVRAPWEVTTVVACLPVLVLGMGTGLAHLLHADAADRRALATAGSAAEGQPDPGQRTAPDRSPDLQQDAGWAAEAIAAADRLAAEGMRISRRNLRAAGVRASNTSLGALAVTLNERQSASGPGGLGAPT
jgi:hypothetical protein